MLQMKTRGESSSNSFIAREDIKSSQQVKKSLCKEMIFGEISCLPFSWYHFHYKKTREIRRSYLSEFHRNGHIPTTFRRKRWSEISGRKKKVRRKFVTNSNEIPISTDRHYSDGYSDNIFHRKCFVGNWSEYISDRCRRRKNVRQNSDDEATPIFRRHLNPSEFPRALIRRNFLEPLSVGVRRKTPTDYFVGNIWRTISSEISDASCSSEYSDVICRRKFLTEIVSSEYFFFIISNNLIFFFYKSIKTEIKNNIIQKRFT